MNFRARNILERDLSQPTTAKNHKKARLHTVVLHRISVVQSWYSITLPVSYSIMYSVQGRHQSEFRNPSFTGTLPAPYLVLPA